MIKIVKIRTDSNHYIHTTVGFSDGQHTVWGEEDDEQNRHYISDCEMIEFKTLHALGAFRKDEKQP
jgi:hypothetical protein